MGRVLVLVHGSMDRAASFTRLSGRLEDWTVVSYDRRGYGGSAHLGPQRRFDDQVADLAGVLVQQAGDAPPGPPSAVFGHSFGGLVVLATAERHPELVGAAIVWEPPQPWQPWWPRPTTGPGGEVAPEDRAERFVRRVVGDRVWEKLPPSTRLQRRAEGPTFDAEMSGLAVEAAFEPTRVRVPVKVGRGGLSPAHHRRGARELAAALPGGEVVELAEAGHNPHLTHPGELARLVRGVAEAGG